MKFKQKLMILGTILSATSFAGSIDYLSQQDAEYLAHPAMVGKIGVSGAYYNPAGLVWLEDGTYIQVNNQTHLKDYSMEYTNSKGKDYNFKSDKASPAVPSVQIVKKAGDTAYFFHAGAIAGGGSVAYGGGIATFPEIADSGFSALDGKFTHGSTIHGQSYYVAFQGGIARKFNETWSGAVGLRLVDAERKFKGEGNFEILGGVIKPKFDIDSERTAFGASGIFGLNYHPNNKFNLAMRYETETKLDFDNKESKLRKGFNESVPNIGLISGDILYNLIGKDPAIKQWMSEGSGRRNLPAVAALGASYKVAEKTTLLASGNYYFIKEAGDDLGNFDHYDNGYEVAVGVDYELNEKWTLMTGYQYTNTGANEKTYTDTDYVLDADMYSMGAKYKYNSQLDLMGTYSFVQYKTDKNLKDITYKKRVSAIGLAAIYKF
ncbi:MAG: OmpP1/FadL family transporter [Cetobacterium sp.]|uniref:OmpP1/FadL family transporter n=1 Tax=Cetobacterium sp. TaxID=2071632 RepID=UPI003F2C6930